MKVWTKTPIEEADFTVDWSDDLEGDTIVTSTWPTVETGITVGSGSRAPSHTATSTTIWLSGGTPGTTYSLVNEVTTAGGRTFTQDVEIRVTAPAVVPAYEGCVWPIDPACLTDLWDSTDETTRTRALALASSALYRLTAYRVGGCPVTVRPSAQNRPCAFVNGEYFGSGFTPMNWNGQWSNLGCITEDFRVVKLPAPVGRIDEVKVDGVALDPSDYAIADETSLVWVGTGEQPWPRVQDWTRPDTEPGTFSVTYLNSYPVDSIGAYAAGVLTMEFVKACGTGRGSACRLPSTVRSIVRQGVSYEIQAGAFPDGLTGIREVDTFIQTWNPKGRPPQQVIIPGSHKVHVVR